MNDKKAKALRREVYPYDGSSKLRKEIVGRRRYLARVKERVRPSGPLNPDGSLPMLVVCKCLTVYNDPESLRSKYQRAKRAV